MYENLVHFRDKEDHIRQLLMQEPRGRPAMCLNLIFPPCNPKADAGFLIMENDEYPPMSGGNTIATTTVLLELGIVPMTEPITKIVLETPAGLVSVTADCEGGKCKAVVFDNVPSFVFALDYKIEVPGLGTVSVDIAWGGMIYGIVDATSLGISINNKNGPKLIEYGERIKHALKQASFIPIHPENPSIKGVSIMNSPNLFSVILWRLSILSWSPPDGLIDARVAQGAVQGWRCSTLVVSSQCSNITVL